MSVGGFVGRLFFKESKMRVLTDLEPKNVFSFFRGYMQYSSSIIQGRENQ